MSRVLGFATFFLLIGPPDARAQDCSGGTFLLSAFVVAGSALYDIGSAPASARRYNSTHLAIVPTVDPGRRSVGLAASFSFGRKSRVPPVPARKSPTTAFVLSAASTAVPMATGWAVGNDAGWELFLGGLIIGPSVGHFYAERELRGLGGIVLRGAGTALGLYSIVPCFD